MDDYILQIKNYFLNAGFIFKEYSQEEDSIYKCKLDLFYNNILISTINISDIDANNAFNKLYTITFKYYISKCFYILDYRLVKFIQDLNFDTNSYYYSDLEIVADNFDALLVDSNFKTIFDTFNKSFYNFLLDNKFILVPFSSWGTSDLKYYNPILMSYIVGHTSIGLGNNNDLAISDAVFSYINTYTQNYLISNFNSSFYEIEYSELVDTALVENINNLNKSGKLHILDLSYNTKFPTVLLVFVDYSLGRFFYSINSNLDFDSAVNDGLSDIYMQKAIPDEDYFLKNIAFKDFLLRGKQNPVEDDDQISLKILAIIEKVLLNTSKKSKNTIYTNLVDIKQHILDLGLNIYYTTLYDSESLVATQVYIPELFYTIEPNVIKSTELTEKFELYNKNLVLQAENFINNSDYSQFEFLSKFKATPDWFHLFADSRAYTIPLSDVLYSSLVANSTYNLASYTYMADLYTYFMQSNIYSDAAKKLALIYLYRASGFSKEDVIKLLTEFNYTITEEDMNNCINIKYIINEVILKSFKAYYTEDKLKGILKEFIK